MATDRWIIQSFCPQLQMTFAHSLRKRCYMFKNDYLTINLQMLNYIWLFTQIIAPSHEALR